MQVSQSKVESPEVSLAAKLTGLFRFVGTRYDGEFLEQLSELDLSLTQLKTLSLLGDAGEPLAVNQVATELGLSEPTASRTADQLVRRKLVARSEDPDDRRIKRLELTAKGQAALGRLIQTRVASFEHMLASLSAEQRDALDAALDALLESPEISRYCPKGNQT